MAEEVRIALLAPSDVATGAELFARAFDADRMARLVAPNADQRRKMLLRGGRKQIERAMAYRHVFGAYQGGVLLGIAVWIPPGVSAPSSEPPPMSALPRLAGVALRHGRSVLSYLRARGQRFSELQAEGGWHLAFLATQPAHQRKGIARRLMEHLLARADIDGVSAWLETSDPRNVAIYERFGFETVGTVGEVGQLPRFWFMRRPPRIS